MDINIKVMQRQWRRCFLVSEIGLNPAILAAVTGRYGSTPTVPKRAENVTNTVVQSQYRNGIY
jgi:hypothetical protein